MVNDWKRKGRKKKWKTRRKDKIKWVKCYNPQTNFAFHSLVSATLLQKNTLLPPRKNKKQNNIIETKKLNKNILVFLFDLET